MMQQVYEVFQELDGGNVEAIIQEPGMNEEKREAFLAEFSAEREKTLWFLLVYRLLTSLPISNRLCSSEKAVSAYTA